MNTARNWVFTQTRSRSTSRTFWVPSSTNETGLGAFEERGRECEVEARSRVDPTLLGFGVGSFCHTGDGLERDAQRDLTVSGIGIHGTGRVQPGNAHATGVLGHFRLGTRKRARRPILDKKICVATCVLTLASLPVSHAVGAGHSSTGEGQGKAAKAA